MATSNASSVLQHDVGVQCTIRLACTQETRPMIATALIWLQVCWRVAFCCESVKPRWIASTSTVRDVVHGRMCFFDPDMAHDTEAATKKISWQLLTMASAVATPPGETALHIPFSFSYMRRGKSTKQEEGSGAASKEDAANPYENSIKTISTVATVESFWATYDFLKRPNDLPSTTDYHFFRNGIKPTWEDASNAKGGKWIVRLPKGLASRYWEEMILALIGGQFSGVPDGEICGAVLSVRYNEDILGVWNRTATDRELTERIRDAIKKVLQLPPQAHMEYKPHQNSLQNRSSLRNSGAWKPKSLEGRASSHGASSHGASSHGTSSGTERTTETRRSGSAWSTAGDERKSKGRDMGRSWR